MLIKVTSRCHTIYLFLLMTYQLPAIVPAQVPAINFLHGQRNRHRVRTIDYCSPITAPSISIKQVGGTRCLQSESAGRTTFSCCGPPYRRRSKAKLARSATVTEVPAVTPVHRNALNGNGMARKPGKRLLAR